MRTSKKCVKKEERAAPYSHITYTFLQQNASNTLILQQFLKVLRHPALEHM